MDMKTWIKKLKEIKIDKKQMLVLLLTGVLLTVISIPTKKEELGAESEKVSSGVMQEDERDYIRYLENHLEELLSQMEGVGDVACMVTLAVSAEQVVEKDLEIEDEQITENDSQGGNRITSQSSHGETTIYREGENNSQEPYVRKEISPQIEGVVILAEGGDQPVIVKNITEAVQALFGIETHKIRMGKKGG